MYLSSELATLPKGLDPALSVASGRSMGVGIRTRVVPPKKECRASTPCLSWLRRQGSIGACTKIDGDSWRGGCVRPVL